MESKLKMVPLAVAMALGAAAPAYAVNGVLFDRTGTGGGESIGVQAMDFAASNVLVKNTVGTATKGGEAVDPVIYAQGILSSFQTGGQSAFSGTEFTFQLKVGVTRSPADPVMNWLDASDTTSYFRLFYDATKDSDGTTGCGFGTVFAGPCVADGSVQILEGTIKVSQASLQENTAQQLRLLDRFPATTTEGNDDQNDVYTIPMTGAMELEITVTSYDSNFFLSSPVTASVDIVLSDQLVTPFSSINPSDQVVGNLIAPSAADLNSTYGPTVSIDHDNDISTANVLRRLNDMFTTIASQQCATDEICDVHAQGAPTMSFNATFVPEPGSLALLGFGLAGLGFAGRRWNRRRS
jgi:hypothetical protein